MNVSKRFLTLLLSVIVLALLASVSLAGPGSFGRADGERDDVVVTDDGEGCDDGTTDEGDGTTDEGDGCESDDGDDSEGETDAGEHAEEGDDEAAEREAACLDAAGIDSSEGTIEEDGEAREAHGLDNAIEHVLANCLKNPQAPGLLNALQRLADNRERHGAHEEWKAEQQAAKDARKAEQQAAKDARKAEKDASTSGHGKGLGGAGGHGNPHDGGSQGNGHH
ncbi:MAG TPA: hypothetical protein VFI59_05185 [Actinomycetota bacterium]|nr:hypothetical protein [Actinomycetota bacterium]